MSVKEAELILKLIDKIDSLERHLNEIERELKENPKFVPYIPCPTTQPYIIPSPTYPYIIYTVTTSQSGTYIEP